MPGTVYSFMRILTISDLRVHDVRTVERVATRLAPDLILYGGDDVGRFARGSHAPCVPHAVQRYAASLEVRVASGELSQRARDAAVERYKSAMRRMHAARD